MGWYRSGVSSTLQVGHTPIVSTATGRHSLQKTWPHMVATISRPLCKIWRKENHMYWEERIWFCCSIGSRQMRFKASGIKITRDYQICQFHFTKKWLVELHSKGCASSLLTTAPHITQVTCAAPLLAFSSHKAERTITGGSLPVSIIPCKWDT